MQQHGGGVLRGSLDSRGDGVLRGAGLDSGFGVPTAVMVYCYASIIRVIWLPSNTGVMFQVEEV